MPYYLISSSTYNLLDPTSVNYYLLLHHQTPYSFTTLLLTTYYLTTYYLTTYYLPPTTLLPTTLLLYYLKILKYILQNAPFVQHPSSAKTALKTGKWLQIWVWCVPVLVQF